MRLLTTLATLAVGAAAMYYADPETGRRRRVIARDKLNAASHDASHLARVKSKRASDRFKGLMARLRFAQASPPRDDDHLCERIRSRLGRLVSHPKAVDVEVRQGRVQLSGHILADEVEGLLRTLSAMTGVQGIDNMLSVHQVAGTTPELQGGRRSRRARRPGQRSMLPLVALAAPLALMLKAMRRGSARPPREASPAGRENWPAAQAR